MLTSSCSCTSRELSSTISPASFFWPQASFFCARPERETPLCAPHRHRQRSKTNPNTTRFTGQVKLHSFLLYTAPTTSAPKTVKLFKNRDNLDFSTASELSPTQTIEVPQPVAGTDVFEVPLNRAHWNTTTAITLFFEDNWSDGEEEVTKVGYIGFKGQFMALNREPVSFLYEAAPNPNDHVAIPGVGSVGGRVMPGQ